MKNLNLLFFLLITLFIFSSCEETDEQTNENQIIGTWKLSSFEYEGDTKTQYGSSVISNPFIAKMTEGDLTLTFNTNNTYTSNGDYTIRIQPDIPEGDDLAIDMGYQNIFNSGVWKQNGNVIVFNEDQQSDKIYSTSTIAESTSTRLVIDINATFKGVDVYGYPFTSEISGRYILVK